MYDRHLSRIANRPGEFLQVKLASKILNRFLADALKQENNLVFDQKEKSTKLIEIGCGSGRMLPIVNFKGIHYTAVEPTHSMRESLELTAKKYSIEKDSFEVSACSLPDLLLDYDKSFDFAIALHVIEHAPNQYAAHEWLNSISKCLKQDGFLLIVTPYYPDYLWRFYDVDWSHGFPTTVNNLVEIIEDLELEVLTATTIRGWISNPIYNAILWFLLKIIPVGLFDFILAKITHQSLLFSGFLASFVRRNTYIVARKEVKPLLQ